MLLMVTMKAACRRALLRSRHAGGHGTCRPGAPEDSFQATIEKSPGTVVLGLLLDPDKTRVAPLLKERNQLFFGKWTKKLEPHDGRVLRVSLIAFLLELVGDLAAAQQHPRGGARSRNE